MQMTCQCKKFRAELSAFPKNTPGRVKCYCDDCQTFMNYLGRTDVLDENGGTEVIPAYPSDLKILSGKEFLRCTRLSPNGMLRFSTTCCNTPIGNTRANTAWLGLLRVAYSDLAELDRALGPIRASVMGKFAKGTPPKGTPQKLNLKGLLAVMPFIIKGRLFKKNSPSPFLTEQNEPIVTPYSLTLDERKKYRPV